MIIGYNGFYWHEYMKEWIERGKDSAGERQRKGRICESEEKRRGKGGSV